MPRVLGEFAAMALIAVGSFPDSVDCRRVAVEICLARSQTAKLLAQACIGLDHTR